MLKLHAETREDANKVTRNSGTCVRHFFRLDGNSPLTGRLRFGVAPLPSAALPTGAFVSLAESPSDSFPLASFLGVLFASALAGDRSLSATAARDGGGGGGGAAPVGSSRRRSRGGRMVPCTAGLAARRRWLGVDSDPPGAAWRGAAAPRG